MIRNGTKFGLLLALIMALGTMASAAETFRGAFAEPADGGNLDLTHSTFDGQTAYLVPRGHESEALGSGAYARRWRNMLFALRGVKGKIVTFHLPARPVETGDMVHNMDSATLNLVEPVWSHDGAKRQWAVFDVVETMKPDASNTPGAHFPADSVADRSGKVVLKPSSPRREDYGWVFRNETPFTEDVVYVSINAHVPVMEFYEWLEADVFTHPMVQPTASETKAGTYLIGYQSGGNASDRSFSREIADTPLYAFQIREPGAQPRKVMMLVSGQHPYEGQTKAALQAAIRWILDPEDPAAAAYRAEYITLVYPFVNPTGELAGIWRGTARDVRRDINRNWNTTLTDPTADRAIDTVIIHKQAMLRDIEALELGAPYALVDLHQNFGDQLPALHYVLHNTNALASAYVRRLQEATEIADIVSNPSTSQTLRGYWQFAGAGMTLTIERSTYSSLEAEHAFGREMMRAFAPDVISLPAKTAPAPLVADATVTAPSATEVGSASTEGGESAPAEAPLSAFATPAGPTLLRPTATPYGLTGPVWFSASIAPSVEASAAASSWTRHLRRLAPAFGTLSALEFLRADQPR